jgi:hypothetical protein
MCDCCLPDWVWVMLQMIIGGGVGGFIFQVMLVRGPEDIKFVLNSFMVCRAILLGIGSAFTWMFIYIHMGKFPEITLDDLQIITVIIYSMVAGYVGLFLLRTKQ